MPGKIYALDCEYVGVGFMGKDDQLARVSIVSETGVIMYDKYVTPLEEVTDYRTFVSGIQPGHLRNGAFAIIILFVKMVRLHFLGIPFVQVQQEVNKLLTNNIVVGHAIHNDFRVLRLSHPFRLTRDTAKYKPLRAAANCRGSPSLKVLAEKVLGIRIQQGCHDSLIDARTALRLYLLHRKKWESSVKSVKRKFQ